VNGSLWFVDEDEDGVDEDVDEDEDEDGTGALDADSPSLLCTMMDCSRANFLYGLKTVGRCLLLLDLRKNNSDDDNEQGGVRR
jgi:hypothetical protein